MSEFEDYPPRILVNLTRKEELSASAVLEVTGLKRKCSFTIEEESKAKPTSLFSIILYVLVNAGVALNVDTKKLLVFL